MHQPARRWLIFSLIILLGLQSCGAGVKIGVNPTPFGLHPLDSVFRDLFEKLGGETVLGQAISPVFYHEGTSCQYTETVLLCYNPEGKTVTERLNLIAIGTLLITPGNQDFKIHEAFMETYSRLYGSLYIGKPLTGVRYNPDRQRIEQYFEKMGFYQRLDEPAGQVHLMAYGVVVCREHCAYANSPGSAIVGWNRGIDVPMTTSILRIGGFDIFGAPLSYPYKSASDGATEQVFESIVAYRPADNPNTIRLRPLSRLLNLPRTAPGPQIFSQKDNMVFYPIREGLGYHVPIPFDAFIVQHGGVEISGPPISEWVLVDLNGVNIARQCFENYCLDYDPAAPAGRNVRLVNLGEQYLKKNVREEAWVFEFSPKSTLLKVSETRAQVSSSEPQTIVISVFQASSKQPISDIESLLVLGKPDGSRTELRVPPTDLQGMAQVTVPPMRNAPNGTVIPYVVCLNVPSTAQICQAESYLIWNIR